MSRTAWIIFSTLCIVLLGGLVWAAQSNRLDVSNVDPWTAQSAEKRDGNIGDHVLGNPDAKVTVIEYGDFQCPGCGAFYPVQKQVTDKYKNEVRFIFRNFPLSTLHPNARAAAAAAEAAGLQGKYWEMHDQLYANQQSWENLNGEQRTNLFTGYAVALGVDKDQFVKDLDNQKVLDKLSFDIALGGKVGVSGTPSIYVNGKIADQSVKNGKLVTANNTDPLVWANADTFENLVIKPALKKAGVPLPKDTTSTETVKTPAGAVAAPSRQ
jgi:hypothetical protein